MLFMSSNSLIFVLEMERIYDTFKWYNKVHSKTFCECTVSNFLTSTDTRKCLCHYLSLEDTFLNAPLKFR